LGAILIKATITTTLTLPVYKHMMHKTSNNDSGYIGPSKDMRYLKSKGCKKRISMRANLYDYVNIIVVLIVQNTLHKAESFLQLCLSHSSLRHPALQIFCEFKAHIVNCQKHCTPRDKEVNIQFTSMRTHFTYPKNADFKSPSIKYRMYPIVHPKTI
jgi:hypothetical protein